MATCPALSTGEAFLGSLLRHIDCQAQTIGASGYQALANPASPVSLLITALLTLFVALFGLRMMLGRAPTVRDGVMAMVKIGIVLTLAGSWPAYRTVVYDVVTRGPAQIAGLLAGPSVAPGADGGLIGRLQAVDAGIVRLTSLGTGREDLAALPSAPGYGPSQRFPINDNTGFGWGRVVFVAGVAGAYGFVRLTAGLLLALAPLFAGLLLLDLARSLASGWARALVFAFLASITINLILGVELALLEPWLAQLITARQSQALAASAPIELLILALGFSLALAGALAVLLRLAFTVDVPAATRFWWLGQIGSGSHAQAEPRVPVLTLATGAAMAPGPGGMQASERPSARARATADAMLAMERRERPGGSRSYAVSAADPRVGMSGQASPGGDEFAIPHHGQARRRAKARTSIGSALRDRRT